MRLATLNDGTKDGRLVIVSPDGTACAPAPVKTMQEAMERWEELAPAFAAASNFPDPLDKSQIIAPLPRAWQWLDVLVRTDASRVAGRGRVGETSRRGGADSHPGGPGCRGRQGLQHRVRPGAGRHRHGQV